ncbi:MAG: hypothetical protein WAT74_09810 [Flavobacteriales bacterium]
MDDYLNSIWGAIQAVSAIVMAVFAVRLYKVTDEQREPVERQQTLLEKQHDLQLSMSRGVLAVYKADMLGGAFAMDMKNTGNAHLRIERVDYVAFERLKGPKHSVWGKGSHQRVFHKWLEPKESYRLVSLDVPGECFEKDGGLKQHVYIAIRVEYSTLGVRRAILSGFVFEPEVGGREDYRRASEYVAAGFGYDVPIADEPKE